MALRFGHSGSNFLFTVGPTAPGIWGQVINVGVTSSAPAGRVNTYAYSTGGGGGTIRTLNLGGPYNGMVAGYALNPGGYQNNQTLIGFVDANGNNQCDLRMNGTGQLFFTRNGTVVGGTSTFAFTTIAWSYFEFKALFSITGTGTCEVRVNGTVVLTSTGLTNATTTASAAAVTYTIGSGGSNSYGTDFYVVDMVSGANTNYLGDVSVAEIFPNGPGVHSQWTPNVGPFVLTSVNTTGTYQGTITGGASNAYTGYNFNITGFVNGANNPTGAICTGSSATAIAFAALTTVTETHAGSAAFQALPQIGINQTGTRPNGDVVYLSDNTTNDISDFAHTTLTLSGIILGVCHLSYIRKDTAGSLQVAQVCLSGGTTEVGATISLGNTYQYWTDILELDPNTGLQWSVSNFNSSTFGAKELS